MFLFQTGFVNVGNISVFVNYIVIFLVASGKKSVLLFLIHLTFTNFLMLFCRGMQKIIAAFGLRIFQDDGDCKTVVYLQRVARGLSISTTSLLTVVQAVTISPRASRWGRLQPRSAWHLSIAVSAQEFVTLHYANLSPFVLIHRSGHLAKCWTYKEKKTWRKCPLKRSFQ
ncbi:vomeronasal type-1 receptor 4-like [Sciurus carolinensis]|uniref:vomeronasal type-1 receptor 4-like n=1 Tax=Sciurus carolinensis TaxID=30640 RepID=UPI001FB41458|nr:vomeronasal type-1 receptor 4-like [Sciurus carolinensis]